MHGHRSSVVSKVRDRRPSRLAALCCGCRSTSPARAPQGDGVSASFLAAAHHERYTLPSARSTTPGVIGISVIGAAPSGASASLTALRTAPGAPAVPASPAPLAPSSESAVGVYIDVGHFRGHRHQIIGHVAVQQLTLRIVDAMLEQ